MEFDCGFAKGNHWFRYRTGGIIVHNNKMLFVKSNIGGYYYMIGGGVHLGENSKACIEREVFEEAGIKAKADHLAVICENFFKGHGGTNNGLDCHTVELYYYMSIADEQHKLCREWTDFGEQLVWLDVNELKNSYVKPTCIGERILEILDSKNIIHIIEERDK